jgi:phenylacetate-coenzyme A ligase PaaK-like adenylate-forming protein
MGHIVSSCKMLDGMHTSNISHNAEIIDDKGQLTIGEDGALILTSSHNYTMPRNRYSIGDHDRMANRICACGQEVSI